MYRVGEKGVLGCMSLLVAPKRVTPEVTSFSLFVAMTSRRGLSKFIECERKTPSACGGEDVNSCLCQIIGS